MNFDDFTKRTIDTPEDMAILTQAVAELDNSISSTWFKPLLEKHSEDPGWQQALRSYENLETIRTRGIGFGLLAEVTKATQQFSEDLKKITLTDSSLDDAKRISCLCSGLFERAIRLDAKKSWVKSYTRGPIYNHLLSAANEIEAKIATLSYFLRNVRSSTSIAQSDESNSPSLSRRISHSAEIVKRINQGSLSASSTEKKIDTETSRSSSPSSLSSLSSIASESTESKPFNELDNTLTQIIQLCQSLDKNLLRYLEKENISSRRRFTADQTRITIGAFLKMLDNKESSYADLMKRIQWLAGSLDAYTKDLKRMSRTGKKGDLRTILASANDELVEIVDQLVERKQQDIAETKQSINDEALPHPTRKPRH